MKVQHGEPDQPKRNQPDFISVRTFVILVVAGAVVAITAVWPAVGISVAAFIALVVALNGLIGR